MDGHDGDRADRASDTVADFWRDGAVCVRGAFSPRAVELAARGDRRQPRRSLAARQAGQRRATTARSSRTSATGSGIAPIEQFIARVGRAPRIAAELMGAGTVRLYHDHVLVKEPGTSQRTPWHQDMPVLQRRRPAERQHVVPRRSGAARVDAASSSPARTAGPGTCRARSSTARPSGSPTASLAELPDDRRRPRALPRPRLGARAGRRRVLPHAHAPRRRWCAAAPTAGVCCRCGSSATTWCTPRGRGPPRRRSPVSSTSSPPARRWTTRCSRSLRPGTQNAAHDGPRDPARRPPGAARDVTSGVSPASELRVAGRSQRLIDDLIDTMHAANGAGIAATQVGERVRIAMIEVHAQPALPVQAADPADGRRSTR